MFVQEWLVEAFTMWGLAALVVAVTVVGGNPAGDNAVYLVVAGLLIAIGVLTALTGARTPVVWFKICPVLLSTSAALLVVVGVV